MIQRRVPLPFQGNKCQKCDSFIAYIKQCSANTFIDLFGGSCYLSYVIHHLKPEAHVITNDYDNYRERLENVETTNEILDRIRAMTTSKPNTKYTPEQTQQIIDIINEFKTNNQFIDSITLSANLCFSGTYYTSADDLIKLPHYFNQLSKNHYNTKWYLESLQGIEFVRKDWQELFNEYKDDPNVCFIADPPYLGTDKSAYSNSFWKLRDSLDTLRILKHPYFVYYTSEKSELLEAIDYINDTFLTSNPITDQKQTIQRSGINHSAKKWLDVMLTNT